MACVSKANGTTTTVLGIAASKQATKHYKTGPPITTTTTTREKSIRSKESIEATWQMMATQP
jgi:hypothetical protein